jgi:hypothetical protein
MTARTQDTAAPSPGPAKTAVIYLRVSTADQAQRRGTGSRPRRRS